MNTTPGVCVEQLIMRLHLMNGDVLRCPAQVTICQYQESVRDYGNQIGISGHLQRNQNCDLVEYMTKTQGHDFIEIDTVLVPLSSICYIESEVVTET